jgi:spoIIIJ-associated protein
VDEHKKTQMDGALFVEDDNRALFVDDEEDLGAASQGSPGDGKAEQAVELLVSLMEHMGLEADVQLREDGARVVLDIQGPDAGRAIGKKGQTLDAMQFLLNKVVNRFPETRRHIVLDSGDYRQRRDEGLIAMARREAKRAVQRGRVVTLEPMSARDRRVIHLSLAKFPGVSTRSEGEGMDRRIQIIPSRGSRGGDA